MSGTGDRPRRVMYVLREYPARSQTYIKCEIDTLAADHDLAITAQKQAGTQYKSQRPYTMVAGIDETCEQVEAFQPDVLHTHWMTMLPAIAAVSARTGVPYTVRSHSFDLLWGGKNGTLFNLLPFAVQPLLPPHLHDLRGITGDDLCLGIICLPFARPRLEKMGVPADKLHDCWPVADIGRFVDRSPNGDRVMNGGAAILKKGMEGFLEAATRAPGRGFDLYAMAGQTAQLAALNTSMGSPAEMRLVEPEDMPAEYKQHAWLLYTGSRRHRSLGWPVSVAEAQASGVGVLMPDFAPDIKEFIGPAGFVYRSFDEALAIMERPYPDEMREAGFEHARRSDIAEHLHVLTDLWATLDRPR